MKHLLFVKAIALLMLWGCGNKTKQAVEASAPESSLYAEVFSQPEDMAVKFPVYDFKSFEPLLHKEDGKTYIINFWATWCKPCIKELPYFERINEEQKKNNVEVILVSLDMPRMWKSQLEPFVAQKGIQAKVVILNDPKQNDWIPKVSETWGGSIPATLVYNTKKRSFYEQAFTYEELNEIIHTFIN